MPVVFIWYLNLSLLQSALALKLEVSGQGERAVRFDHWSLILFPVLFFGWSGWIIYQATH